MGFSLTISRDERAQVKQALRESVVLALDDAASELLRTANETVPYREGILESSGEVQPVDEAALRVDVTYGGEAEAYAVKQHEDESLSHPSPGRAKWLEMAAKENAERLGTMIAEGTREYFG
jgi:hypothetical protein